MGLKVEVIKALTAQHLAVVGRTGSGKTYAAKSLVEYLLLAGRQVVVLDPTGAWWGLRLSADGKKAGFPVYVLGGDHGDLPLPEKSGGDLAKWLVLRGASVVVDLSEMLMGERHRFVERFAESLYVNNRKPLVLVVDEADEFMPQNPLPESRRMLGHMDRIVRRGRIRGFRVILITQRPAVLHKNVLAQASAMVAMRLMAPQDRKAVEEWVRGQGAPEGERVLLTLAKLKRGEGWVWAPEAGILHRQHFPKITTLDSSREPEAGDSRVAVTAFTADLRAGVTELGAVLSGLEAPEGQSEVAESEPERLAAVSLRTYDDGVRDGYAHGVIEGRGEVLTELQDVVARVSDAVTDLAGRYCELEVEETKPPDSAGAGGEAPRARAGSRELGPERKILGVLAARAHARYSSRDWAMLAVMSCSGTFQNYVSRLHTGGYVVKDSGGWHCSGLGLTASVGVRPVVDAEELQRAWMHKLGGGPAKLLRELLRAHPSSLTRASLPARVGMANSGTFQNYLSRLRTNGLVHSKSGRIVVNPLLINGR